ncbi:serine hydrolase domain-containing protein [Fodinicurvata fenggangensis]|uniref:serine hydrolase domain-containing protein n=1 Tax=Fodinicurvata fenggangensis TaxID=1121830 RepID=UPI001FE15268|nr:serine hydrolase [Fodinicurvata fenggangensis]
MKLGLTAGAVAVAGRSAGAESVSLDRAVGAARDYERLHGLIVAQEGRVLVEEVFRGPALDQPVNVKSVAKTVIAALVGVAIHEGVLKGADQPVVPLLGDLVPENADPQLQEVTVGNLLSMQAGLERTSGQNYGAWVTSPNWVRHALSRPFVAEPGGEMRYSTGNSHLLSVLLTRASGRSTLELARDWLGAPLGIEIPAWQQDPQGYYFGGNNMALSPRALLPLGELYRLDGTIGGARVFAGDWPEISWRPRGRSRWTGDRYGYGWFIRSMAGRQVYYGWGYGGQMIYVCPELAATLVMTSDTSRASGASGYVQRLHDLVERAFLPALEGA